MKIAATEAQWDTCQPCAFSLFQIGGFTERGPDADASRSRSRSLLSFLADRLVQRRGAGDERAASGSTRAKYGRGQLHPAGRIDLLEHAGDGVRRAALVFLVARARGLPLLAAAGSRRARWFLWSGVAAIAAPVRRGARRLGAHGGRAAAVDRVGPAEDGGRQLAERLHGHDRASASASSSSSTSSLLVVDFVLMRRYARVDPPEVGGEGDEFALPGGRTY